MTSDEFDPWRVVYCQFVGADSKYGISFALNNAPEARDSCEVRKINGRNGLRKRPMAGVSLRDLDPETTVHIWLLDIHKHHLCCLQRKNTLQKAMELTQIR